MNHPFWGNPLFMETPKYHRIPRFAMSQRQGRPAGPGMMLGARGKTAVLGVGCWIRHLRERKDERISDAWGWPQAAAWQPALALLESMPVAGRCCRGFCSRVYRGTTGFVPCLKATSWLPRLCWSRWQKCGGQDSHDTLHLLRFCSDFALMVVALAPVRRDFDDFVWGLDRNVISFNATITACARARHWQEAWETEGRWERWHVLMKWYRQQKTIGHMDQIPFSSLPSTGLFFSSSQLLEAGKDPASA